MFKNNDRQAQKQAQSERIEKELIKYLGRPVLETLNKRADRRLVKTFLGIIMDIIIHRDRQNDLLLSELGACLMSRKNVWRERNGSATCYIQTNGKRTSSRSSCGNKEQNAWTNYNRNKK